MGIFNEGGVMESAVPRPAVVAPVPATMSPEMRMIRQGMAPTTAPVARTAPTVSVTPKVSTMAPVLAAQQAYRETSNPFDAFLQGWTVGGEVRNQQDIETQKMEQVASALESHPDLAQFVRSNVMEPADAIRIAGDRDATTQKSATDKARKDQISAYLTELAGSDERYAEIAKQWAAGVIDEDGVAAAVQKVDEPAKDVPAGYRYNEAGDLEAIPGGPSDPANPLNEKKLAGTGRSLTAAEIKELFDAQDGIAAGEAVTTALDKALTLNETAWDGPLADIGTQTGALVGDENSADTQELKNLVTAQALDQLKATFGAVPTEGERKILLEIQGSVNQSREVRKRIFERAKAAADRRVKENRIKAEGIQTGDYRRAGFDPTGSDEGAPDLSGLSDEELLQQLNQ